MNRITHPTGYFIGKLFRKVVGAVFNGIFGEFLSIKIPGLRSFFTLGHCALGNALTCAAATAGNAYAGGAMTAAFAFVYNELKHRGVQGEKELEETWRDNVKELEKLEGLSEEFRPMAEAVLKELSEKGYKLRIIWGRRTQAENQLLVKQRNAISNSLHLTGEALDFVNRLIGYDNINHPQYNSAVEQAAKNAGVTWGGHFKSRWDPNHIELQRQ